MLSRNRPTSLRSRRVRGLAAPAVARGAAARALTGCSGSPADPASTTIVLYNAQHEQTTTALVAAFTKRTGIIVRIANDDEGVLAAKIQQEGSRSPADVIFTENSNWLQQLADKGLLA